MIWKDNAFAVNFAQMWKSCFWNA